MQRAKIALAGSLLIAVTAAGRAEVAGDPARGERVFQQCNACHAIDPSDTVKVQGPNLSGVVGRRAASWDGFEYSSAMLKKAEEGLVWDGATLDRYLQDPEAVVPGTAMRTPPLRDAQERADLVAYLLRTNAEAR